MILSRVLDSVMIEHLPGGIRKPIFMCGDAGASGKAAAGEEQEGTSNPQRSCCHSIVVHVRGSGEGMEGRGGFLL